MRPTLTIAALVAIGSAVGPLSSVHAADAPSAAQIIDSLSPTSGGGGAMTTRGIRLGGQPPAAEKPGTPASTGGAASTATGAGNGAVATQSTDKPHEANLPVPFPTGSAAISPAASRVLDQLGEALASPKLADFKFRVEGHTDTVGQPESNKSLSERRAASVVDYLATKYHVDRSRLTPVGMGQDGLLIETGPGVPNADNRRVVVVNLGQ
jgi:OOP family OmpA-OmpF porin